MFRFLLRAAIPLLRAVVGRIVRTRLAATGVSLARKGLSLARKLKSIRNARKAAAAAELAVGADIAEIDLQVLEAQKAATAGPGRLRKEAAQHFIKEARKLKSVKFQRNLGRAEASLKTKRVAELEKQRLSLGLSKQEFKQKRLADALDEKNVPTTDLEEFNKTQQLREILSDKVIPDEFAIDREARRLQARGPFKRISDALKNTTGGYREALHPRDSKGRFTNK